jgi:hypothetical protein
VGIHIGPLDDELVRVAFHQDCLVGQRQAQGVVPRQLLEEIAGLQFRDT